MGAIDRSGYRFVPEYSVTHQNGAIHVYQGDTFIDELTFTFSGKQPEPGMIEQLVEDYCDMHADQ